MPTSTVRSSPNDKAQPDTNRRIMPIAFVSVTLPIIPPATLFSRRVARLGSHAVRPSVLFILALWNGFAILFFFITGF
jgi:hypothetical protein